MEGSIDAQFKRAIAKTKNEQCDSLLLPVSSCITFNHNVKETTWWQRWIIYWRVRYVLLQGTCRTDSHWMRVTFSFSLSTLGSPGLNGDSCSESVQWDRKRLAHLPVKRDGCCPAALAHDFSLISIRERERREPCKFNALTPKNKSVQWDSVTYMRLTKHLDHLWGILPCLAVCVCACVHACVHVCVKKMYISVKWICAAGWERYCHWQEREKLASPQKYPSLLHLS